jgi:IMP dehydrogenase
MITALTFDDINLIPKYSDILHRNAENCDTETLITTKRKIQVPIISAPMDTVTELEMALSLYFYGGIGCIHRFMSIEDQRTILTKMEHREAVFSVGVTGDWYERFEELYRNGCRLFCLDVAHGHHILVKQALDRMKSSYFDAQVIAGNIATFDAAQDLIDWGADSLRVGIGPGAACETRIRTGVGVPQVTAILETVRGRNEKVQNTGIYVPVIADGGIKLPGDVCKALAIGADTVMLGSLLAATKETPGIIEKHGIWPNEQLVKKYQGSASLDSKLNRGESGKNVEGNSRVIPYKGKASRILNDIMDGVYSMMSYLGVRTISELQKNTDFYQVTAAGAIEAQPHIML